MLWSRIPLLTQEIKHLVSERRPSIFATVDVAVIGPVRFVCAHPLPPGLQERTVSIERDAELMLIACNVEKDWIVTGDFNDVACKTRDDLFEDVIARVLRSHAFAASA